MNIDILNKLECILKELSSFEKMGLDTSSLNIFIKIILTPIYLYTF